MGFYAIGLLMGCVFLSAIDVVEAIQCHRCSYTNIVDEATGDTYTNSGDSKCKDPFDSTGIEVVECSGQCYANQTDVSFGGTRFEEFSRGCAANAGIDCEAFQGCQDTPGSLACVYCCDQTDCNSQDISQGFDENLFKCYYCLAYVDDNGMPVDNDTCGRADFDGTNDPYNVIELPCQTGTCFTQIIIAEGIVARGCAEEEAMDLCENKETIEALSGIKINCCTEELCNVGRPSLEPPVTSEPRPVIDCFTCAANLTADGLPVDQSSCGRADFDGSGQDVFFLPCETGVCTTIYIPANDTASTSSIQRSCFSLPAEFIPFCDNPALLEPILGFKVHMECCYEDECNTVNLVPTDSDATTEKTLVTVIGTDKLEYTMSTSDKLGDTLTTSGADGITKFAASSAAVLIFSAAFFTYGVV